MRSAVDVIVAVTAPAARAVQRATSTIPIACTRLPAIASFAHFPRASGLVSYG